MDEERPELDWHFYIGVLRRRYPIILLITVLAVGVAFARSATATRIYEATSLVLVSDPGAPTGLNQGDNPSVDIPTEIQLIYSGPVRAAAQRTLGDDAAAVTNLSVTSVGDTRLIAITAQSASARVARRAANAYANQYVDVRKAQATDNAEKQIRLYQERLDSQTAELTALDAQIENSGGTPSTEQLARRIDIENRIEATNQQIDDLRIQSELRVIGGAVVVQQAGLPTDPVEPTPLRDILLGLALGLVLGLALAFLTEFLDDKIKSAEDIARYGKGLTTLAEIPTINRERHGRRLVALDDSSSGAAEAYRSLRTSLRLIGLRSPIGTLLVTSSMAGEGKTTTVANLGVTMARAGVRVVLVDLDLRRANLAQIFGGENERGLMSVLVGEAQLEDVMMGVPVAAGVPPLAVLPAGVLPPNPSEVMSTGRLADVLATLSEISDLVIIDSPPIVPVTDAVVLSARVDSVLMIVKAGRTRRRHLAKSMDMLAQAEAPIIGSVLNDAGRHVRYGYYYRYGRERKKSRYYGRDVASRPVAVDQAGNGNGALRGVGSASQSRPES
jgi:capsular exopolysaccharide synthesis family protein